MIPSSWVHLSTVINLQLPSLLLQITAKAHKTRDGVKTRKRKMSEWGGRRGEGGDKARAAFKQLDQSPDHLPVSMICPLALRYHVCLT